MVASYYHHGSSLVWWQGKIVLHLLIGIQFGKKDNILGSIPNQFGSIPNPHLPKPRPTTPTNFSEISTVLHQKEKFGFLKIIYAYRSINRKNSFSESTVSDLFKKVKVGWVWLEIFWPVRFYFGEGTKVAGCWLERSELRKSGIWNGICKRLDLCLNHITALIEKLNLLQS